MSIGSNVHIYKKTTDPSSAPLEVGQHWINTTNGNHYLSKGTSSSADWILVGVGSATDAPSVINQYTSTSGTSALDLVVLNSSGEAVKITTNSTTDIPTGILGICTSKPSSTTANVLTMGIVSGYSSLTVGAPVFVSTAGVLTQTVPSTGVVQQIGFAKSATSIFVNLKVAMHRG